MAPPPTTPSFLRPPPLPHHSHPRLLSRPPSASFRVAEILGGRGLCNGEVGIRKELASSPPPSTTTSSPASSTDSTLTEAAPPAVDPDAFEKELLGLTGGFPGGEVGLKDFVAKNPPPPPPSKKSDSQPKASLSAPPRPPELPLFLPGMVVLVKNPNNAYHMYCGIVQRVTDGKVAVLFEGGNWDRLITFNLDELEGREKGPPMVNPKSVVLEELLEELEDDDDKEEDEAAKKEEGAAAVA
ncbi:NAD(P)H-quinone oxidoreductase subunit S, chloroplastic [Dichanthelium oligosanthes]|uniref:NAD(P)H-quinone oxidoreductase subunit S, chloroplastic n=1 Tax=Dichanthelium oligosanthes TaxID=888268 RepID=A0A1E5W3R0_9POAL|nr:NAD(P)H-quinone oxidoreductase subunit S, chloroplastic [Dichanthelium oligosanthes]